MPCQDLLGFLLRLLKICLSGCEFALLFFNEVGLTSDCILKTDDLLCGIFVSHRKTFVLFKEVIQFRSGLLQLRSSIL